MPRAKPAHPRVPASRLLARRRRVRAATAAGGILVVASVLFSHVGASPPDDWSRFDRRRFTVSHVIAGNSLLVRLPGGGETPIRLVGVAAPEAGASWAGESRRALADRVDGKDVTLRLGSTRTRATDGVLLATLYADDPDGVNLELLRTGNAFADRHQVHPYARQFNQAESEARSKRRGLWGAAGNK